MKVSKIGIAASLMFFAGVVAAGIADDFKNASNSTGCDAIPYSSERETCKRADVDGWCKSKKWSCDDLDPSGLNRNIDNVNSKISDLKKEQSDLESKRNNAKDDSERRDYDDKIKDKKNQIEALQAKVDAWKKQIDSERSLARDRQDVGERCIAERKTVQKAFADAKYKVERESDADAKQYASKLVSIYDSEAKGHQEAIDITQKGIDKCKGMR
ncbi:MAG TPA: hypothetical protein VFQ53_27825 [Kofleriaceae bacterium]|nr:hypothetical protein [Kofleriaceae bacterium]